MEVRTIWEEEGRVWIIDQTLLPGEFVEIEISSAEQMWQAIKALQVRGAPAIGIAAAFGLHLGVRGLGEADAERFDAEAERIADYLATSRPTAVNLFWGLDRMRRVSESTAGQPVERRKERILGEARAILAEDNEVCLAMAKHGAALLESGMAVLTHCNAGGLVTACYGTALSVIWYAVKKEGKDISVFVDETRPLLQGARLTAWELMRANIPATLICDNMAASVMQKGLVQAVIVGTDRVAANGDFANKIGTYGVAVLAREHGIPLYVAAPLSSVDLKVATGDDIPIEERAAEEVTTLGGRRVAPEGVRVYNPAFDVTPNKYVAAFITEKGVLRPPFGPALQKAVGGE